MKTLTIKSLSVLLLTGLIAFQAQSFEGKLGKRFEKELELTQQQKKDLEVIKSSVKNERVKNKERRDEIKQLKRDLLVNYSEKQALDIANKSASLHKQKVLSRLKLSQDIYKILDDRQKILFQAMLEREAKKQHRNKGNNHKHCKHH